MILDFNISHLLTVYIEQSSFVLSTFLNFLSGIALWYPVVIIRVLGTASPPPVFLRSVLREQRFSWSRPEMRPSLFVETFHF
jgi:hypothetical protein